MEPCMVVFCWFYGNWYQLGGLSCISKTVCFSGKLLNLFTGETNLMLRIDIKCPEMNFVCICKFAKFGKHENAKTAEFEFRFSLEPIECSCLEHFRGFWSLLMFNHQMIIPDCSFCKTYIFQCLS